MKNQRKKTEARNFRFATLAVVLLALATLICCFTVLVSAAGTQVSVKAEDLTIGGFTVDASGIYTKVYDGNANVTVTPSTDAQARLDAIVEDGDDATVKVSAEVVSTDASEIVDAGKKNIVVSFTVEGEDAAKYKAYLPTQIVIPAEITKAPLSWSGEATATTTYVPGQSVYENLDVVLKDVNDKKVELTGFAGDDSFTPSGLKASVSGVTGVGSDYKASVAVSDQSLANYEVAPLTVKVTVEQLQLEEIKWADKYSFVKGDVAASAIRVTGWDNETQKEYELKVIYLDANNNEITLDPNVVGSYFIKVVSPDPANIALPKTGYLDNHEMTITKPVYTVSMNDASYISNVDLQANAAVYKLLVSGTDIPADVLAQIKYYVNGEEFNGTSAYGTYTVKAVLPTGDYTFYAANDPVNPITELEATLTIKRAYVVDLDSDAPYQVILVGENGFHADVTADVTIPEKLNRKAIGGFNVHTKYTLTVSGANGETFTVLIPISDTLYNKRCSDLTANDIYIYDDVTGTMTSAAERGYTVSLLDGYYQVEGVSGTAAITFVIAPEYNAPFWLTPWGIALIILLVLALFALLLLIGLYLRRVRLSEENEEMVVDTEGEVPAVVPVVIEDKVADADTVLEENLDQMAEALAEEVDAEQAEDSTEGLEEAVAESMQEIIDEASALELDKEEPVEEEETDLAAEMADEKAEELQDAVEVEEAEAEADEDALRAAVEEALAENFNESADATDAIVLLAADEEESNEITPEDFKAVVDSIVSDAMCATMQIPEELLADEETVEAAAEETAEAVAEETVEENAEVAEETAEETTEEIVVEQMSDDEICAVVADSVAEAFEMVTVDGVTPKAVEGTTIETITEAVNNAGDANIPETWTEDMAKAVKEAVTEELAARLLIEEEVVEEPVQEEAVEAFAAVEEEKAKSDEDDDNDNDDGEEEEEESYEDFSSMPLEFFDAVAEAERYRELLEQEARGEVRIVTRYRKSFQCRLAQSQGNVQDYYSIIKNALLSYRGVKSRISWNYEAFNKGRTHLAKLNAKTKTLYLYLALDPAELADTKYGIVDMSAKKKYASVPVLMKIKGERKFKYALELIDKLCGENLTLPKMEIEAVDYRVPYQTIDELVEAGIVKKMVASIPVVYSDAPVSEEPVEPVTPATEDQTVTFVAPSDAPAVEAAAEEVAAEEAVPVEEVPADAPANDEEPKNI